MRTDLTSRDVLLDRRVVERNIRKGLVTREEYDRYVAGLPDVSDQAIEIRAKLGEEEPGPRAPALAASSDEDDEDDVDDAEEDDTDEG